MDSDKMDENDWRYHGEGNKSLVVSHIQVMLRLLKYPAADSENPPQTAEQAYRQIQNIVDFTSSVMSSLIGDEYRPFHLFHFHLSVSVLRPLNLSLPSAWRCNKVMDIYSGCALCLPNLTTPLYHQPTLMPPPLCIEIKPKCGFLPSSKHVSKEIKTRVCRFCMHQHYKVSNGMWRKRSLYCPLDLFSGSGLPSDCVLSRILHTQLLDSLDIEGLFPLYRRVEQHLHQFPKERSRLQVDGPYDEAFLEKIQKCPSEDDGSVEFAASKSGDDSKDCSVMITLCPRQRKTTTSRGQYNTCFSDVYNPPPHTFLRQASTFSHISH
uniref:Inositol-pentakisphosphate 2-kinase n=1 Tax=Neogobius melanostomus TaxID=47308 RepID=A0A8C6V134_9GOBI